MEDFLQTGGAAAAGGLFTIIYLAIAVLIIVSMWILFTKAKEPGWAILIPIYNIFVLLKIAGKPIWWIILYFIPFVNIVVMILVTLALAAKFGKETGFAIGMIFLPFIFYPILAFGDAKYKGG